VHAYFRSDTLIIYGSATRPPYLLHTDDKQSFLAKGYYYQGPYWFLGILLFSVKTALADTQTNSNSLSKVFHYIDPHFASTDSNCWVFFRIFLYGMRMAKHSLYQSFQPSRILTYFCYFLGFVLSVRKLPLAVISLNVGNHNDIGDYFIILKGKSENTSIF
jgi:hypothetical protein